MNYREAGLLGWQEQKPGEELGGSINGQSQKAW
jgi:hypothetical protein